MHFSCPVMTDVCGDKIILGYNESVIIYSNNDRQSRSCQLKVKVSLILIKYWQDTEQMSLNQPGKIIIIITQHYTESK